MKKIRINELARELEVKPGVIIDMLPELGVQEKKTHSSSIDEDVALELKHRLTGPDAPPRGTGDSNGHHHDYDDHEQLEHHEHERESEAHEAVAREIPAVREAPAARENPPLKMWSGPTWPLRAPRPLNFRNLPRPCRYGRPLCRCYAPSPESRCRPVLCRKFKHRSPFQ